MIYSMLEYFRKIINRSMMTTRGKTTGIESWLDMPAFFSCPEGNAEGLIQYGIRIPLAPATRPFKRVDNFSKEEIEGCYPAYWFVSTDKPGLKILLRRIYSINDKEIHALIRDGKYTANATIRKRY